MKKVFSKYQVKNGLNVWKPWQVRKQPRTEKELLDALSIAQVQAHDIWVRKISQKIPNITEEVIDKILDPNNKEYSLPKIPKWLRKHIRQVKWELKNRIKKGYEKYNRENLKKTIKRNLWA